MTKQVINVGTTANDKKGDSLRAAFQKVNTNFTELYTALGLSEDTTLNLGAFEFTGSTMTTTDSSGITIDQATTITSDLTVGGDIVPSVANGGNLGSLSRPFKSLYVSTSTVYLGGVPLSLDGSNNLLVNNAPISTSIEYASIPNAPTDIADLTDNTNLLGGGSTNQLVNGANTVSLGSDGTLTLPGTGTIRTAFGAMAITAPTGSSNLSIKSNDLSTYMIVGNGSAGVTVGSYNWTFGNNGKLSVPATSTAAIEGADGSNVRIRAVGEDASAKLEYYDGSSTTAAVGVHYNSVTINADDGVPTSIANFNGQGGWNSGFYSNLVTTGGTGTGLTVDVAAGGGGYISIGQITINTPGTGYTEGDVITITNEYEISSTFTVSILPPTWEFNANGRTTFPAAIAPAHSYGAAGDVAGMVAFTSGHIYYCTNNFNTPAAHISESTADGSGPTNFTKTSGFTVTTGMSISVNNTVPESTITSVADNGSYWSIETNPAFPVTTGTSYYIGWKDVWKRVAWAGSNW